MLAASPDWAEIWTAAATTGALPIIFVAYRQFRDSARSRHSELLLDLATRWSGPDLMEAQSLLAGIEPADLLKLAKDAYRDPPTRTTEKSATAYRAISSVPDFFELVGGLWRYETCLPIRAIDVVWGYSIPTSWRQWEPTVEWLNEKAAALPDLPEERSEEVYENFRKLARVLEALKPRWRERMAAFMEKAEKAASATS